MTANEVCLNPEQHTDEDYHHLRDRVEQLEELILFVAKILLARVRK